MTTAAVDMASYECKVCWYQYEPEQGDDVAQIPPGTAFADLPADWCCPGCDAHKSTFLKVTE